MNPTDRPPPSDDELDRLLASRFKDTTPDFEARWIDLKRQLRTAPPRRRVVPSWAVWLGAISGGVTVLAILLALHPWRVAAPPPGRTVFSPAFAELFDIDDALAPATTLLDAENREALLHLPANPQPRT